jgi:hypothetical protein
MISRKIAEWNRQDAKVAERERKKRLLDSILQLFPLCVFLATVGVLAVQSPAFLFGLTTTPESIKSHRETSARSFEYNVA